MADVSTRTLARFSRPRRSVLLRLVASVSHGVWTRVALSDDARLSCRSSSAQQGPAVSGGPAHRRGDRGGHAYRRRGRARAAASPGWSWCCGEPILASTRHSRCLRGGRNSGLSRRAPTSRLQADGPATSNDRWSRPLLRLYGQRQRSPDGRASAAIGRHAPAIAAGAQQPEGRPPPTAKMPGTEGEDGERRQRHHGRGLGRAGRSFTGRSTKCPGNE
jgi:hypothetical protein